MSVVGQNYYTGNSEVVVSIEVKDGVTIKEGSAVMLDNEGKLVTSDGTSFIGIAGYSLCGSCSVVVSSLKTYVLLASGVTPQIGAQAFVDATGAISDTGSIQVGTFVENATTSAVNSRGEAIQNSVAITVDGKNAVKKAS